MQPKVQNQNCLYIDRQISTFQRIFCDEKCLPCNVHIFGAAGCGKTVATKNFISSLKVLCYYVDCVESCQNDRKLFELILNILLGDDKTKKISSDCANANEFVRKFSQILLELKKGKDESFGIVLIIDNAERLRNFKSDVLAILFQLIKMLNANVNIITISKLPWSNFCCQFSLTNISPVQVYFPAYTKEQLIDILCQHQPTDFDNPHLFRLFAQYLMDVYYLSCRDLKELLYLVKINICYLNEFVNLTKDDRVQSKKLWPFLQKRFNTDSAYLYRRGFSESERGSFYADLPLKTKYLLIAAYMASYNPLKVDAKFLLKKSEKNRRSNKTTKVDEMNSQHLRGPKVFSLERLFMIFTKISEQNSFADDALLVQLATLCSLKLLQKCTSDQLLDVAKYKCTTPYAVVKTVAQLVDFDLNHYLNDFNP